MDDTISRQQAIYACLELAHERRKWMSDAGQKEINGIDAVMCAIQDLPTAPSGCEDCVKSGGDWECDHVHCHKGGNADNRLEKIADTDTVSVVRCKDCKYFEYDHLYMIQGIPVLGHLVCNKWGDGCRTNENGFCFMGERKNE